MIFETQKRPNILLLMTDQHRHDELGCVNPVIQTANLDALAARGVRFSQAVCKVPMCVPSLYSMMTGVYGFQTGVKHNTQMVTRDADLAVPVLEVRCPSWRLPLPGGPTRRWPTESSTSPTVSTIWSPW